MAVHDFWVFGYGSLMWNPGFAFIERRQAIVHGFHRSLCMYSYMYRGTPERPGLVLGLDHGGACHGVAFRVAPEDWEKTLAYLRAREQVTGMYREVTHPARLAKDISSPVGALTYVVDRTHAQYAGRLDHETQMRHIKQGHGQSGSCRDYVLNTVAHLRELGIRDRPLEKLAVELALVPTD
jgi:glutathione-specific gamma-glutamylcyclotransferase